MSISTHHLCPACGKYNGSDGSLCICDDPPRLKAGVTTLVRVDPYDPHSKIEGDFECMALIENISETPDRRHEETWRGRLWTACGKSFIAKRTIVFEGGPTWEQ